MKHADLIWASPECTDHRIPFLRGGPPLSANTMARIARGAAKYFPDIRPVKPPQITEYFTESPQCQHFSKPKPMSRKQRIRQRRLRWRHLRKFTNPITQKRYASWVAKLKAIGYSTD